MAIDQQKLSPEQQELVAVGASVGAGCHPCVDYHLKAGTRAGLDGERLMAAITSAERVTAEAADLMAAHVRAKLDRRTAAADASSALDDALAAFGAALGANDTANIERQMRTAVAEGASRAQLQQAIETARTVQENATRIHIGAAERQLDLVAPATGAAQTEAGGGCGCAADDDGEAPHDSSEHEPVTSETSGPAASWMAAMWALFAGDTGERSAEAPVAGCGRLLTPNSTAAADAAAGACAKEVVAP